MANTVNDVMNVISSPDYGIKNIAGTTQEILAILQGAHNSQNNIHVIVDDVKYLLQQLVVASTTEKKNVEIDNNKSIKINHKNIQNIFDETKNITKAISDLSKAILKQGGNTPTPAIAKLSDKSSEKVAEAMIKNIDKQNKNGGLSSLVDAFNKLKNISLKDIIIGNQKVKLISKVFKNAKEDLKISDKDLNAVIKLINSAPEMMKALRKVSWRIDRIIKNNVIGKLTDILVGKTNSLLSLSRSLKKNEKTFNNANKTAKDIKELASSLNKAMMELVVSSIWSKFANNAITSLEKVIDNLIPLSKKLIKNTKDIDKGAKAAKNITVLVGNLLTTSIFLTIAIITAVPAILGATLLSVMVDIIIPVAKKISKNNKEMSESAGSALAFTALTGLMLISTYFLAKISENGLEALLGSIVVFGIITINIITFKSLGEAEEEITKGAIAMAIMSVSLLLFGVALGKISQATKDVTWKQFGMIAALTGLFAVVVGVMGIEPISGAILLGSIAMITMSVSLLIFGVALGKISQATKDVTWKQFGMIVALTGALSVTTAAIGFLIVPIALGAAAMLIMSIGLLPFAISLSLISKATEKMNSNQVNIITESMESFAESVSYMALLSIPIALGSVVLGNMGVALYKFVKSLKLIKDMGEVPIKEVHQTLNAMDIIGSFFTKNALNSKATKSAKSYNKIIKPLIESASLLAKLKELGGVPLGLVMQTLNAMSAIGQYYLNNPIEKKVIKQAKRYKDMLKPFGNTLQYLVKLKELGGIPMGLVMQTLNAMSAISNYYINNPVDKDAIKQAKIYKNILEPFGSTIENLTKLKELGNIPKGSVEEVVSTLFKISWFYKSVIISDDIESKGQHIKDVVINFTNIASEIQDKFANIKSIDAESITSIVNACGSIIDYYNFSLFFAKEEKILKMNNAILSFANNIGDIKTKIGEFTESNCKSIEFGMKGVGYILNFLKENTLGPIDRLRARLNINLLQDMSSVLSNINGVNSSNISSVGGALSSALQGVNTVNMDQVNAVTNMFNAFNSINKSENIINKFTESVNNFTEACNNLLDAMGLNTDAINNMDNGNIGGPIMGNVGGGMNSVIETTTSEDGSETKGIRISNVDEIARNIADKINGSLSLDIPDTQIQLLINGTGGNEWILTRY